MNRESKELLLALIDDKADIVTTLLELTNSVNIQLPLQSLEIPALLAHDPPLIAVAIFFNALNCISALLLHRANLSITDSLGRGPLHFASAFGNLPILELLSDCGAPLASTDSKQRNILHYAAKFGHNHVIQWIIAKQLILIQPDSLGFTPLHFAAESGNEIVIAQLLAMDHPQTSSLSGWTPLLFAAKHDNLPAFRILLSHGGDIRIGNEQGELGLHWACFNGNVAMARLCLSSGIGVNVLTKKGETPLIFAAMNDHFEMVQFLLEAGADPQICGVYLALKKFVLFGWTLFVGTSCTSRRIAGI